MTLIVGRARQSALRWASIAAVAGLLVACGGARHSTGVDLVVSSSGPTDPVAPGQTIVFQASVQNVSGNTADDVKIIDQVGNFLALTGITCQALNGAVCPTTTGPSMSVGPIPPQGRLDFAISVTVNANGSGTVTNTVTANVDDDISRTDNSSTAQAVVNAATPSDIVVTGVNPSTTVAAGGTMEFVITVAVPTQTSAGVTNGDATNVKITDSVGSNLTLTGITCTPSGGATCPTALGPVMTLATLPAGGSLELHVQTTVRAGTSGSVINTMAVTADNDNNRDNNTATSVGVAYADDVVVTATTPAGPIPGGAATSITVTATNPTGPATALDVDFTNTFGANLSLGGTITCTATGGAVCPATTGLTMRSPSIPVGASLTFTIPVTVAAGANGNQVSTMTASAAGDPVISNNTASVLISAESSDLGVSQEAAATVPAGTSAVFKVLVANPGPGSADNLAVHWSAAAPFPITGVTITCQPTGGGTCPPTLAADMTVLSLSLRSGLLFTFTAPVPSTGRGPIVSTATVSADGDSNTTNNTSVATTTAIDANNGLYRAYAADGRSYDMTVDFDARSYTMAGNGGSSSFAFTADGAGNFVVAGNTEFRVAQDLIVGAHPFSNFIVPYVAARVFITSTNAASGSYNFMTLNVNPDGTGSTTHPGTARVGGNQLQVCQDDFVVVNASGCASGDLQTYLLSISDDVFTGVNVDGGPSVTFRVAKSGAASVLLGVGPSSSKDSTLQSTLQWQIGLTDNAGTFTTAVTGPGFNGYLGTPTNDWLGIEVQNGGTLVTVSGALISDLYTLSVSLGFPPPSTLLTGTPTGTLAGGTVWVMQSFPLVVVIGDPLTSSLAPLNLSGLLQIGVP